MRTKILTTVAAGVVVASAFTAVAAADDTPTGDLRSVCDEMSAQMGAAPGGGMASEDMWTSMQAIHAAIDPAVMQQMHDQVVEQLPAELRDDAEAMHDQMLPAMPGVDVVDHASHHQTDS